MPGENVVADFTSASTTLVTVDTLVISPAGSSIPAGDSRQFVAGLIFSNGEQLPANNVVWSADGQVSIDATGFAMSSTDGLGSVTASRARIAVSRTCPKAFLPRELLSLKAMSSLGMRFSMDHQYRETISGPERLAIPNVGCVRSSEIVSATAVDRNHPAETVLYVSKIAEESQSLGVCVLF